MRFFHLSDLHIGKQLHFYSLVKDQEYILSQIVEKAKQLQPDAIVIAGDIYDKSVPSGEAYQLFDSFLNQLSEITPAIPTMIIAGNHDSAQRLQYASSFLEKHKIYISVQPPMEQDEHLKKVTLTDEYGEVDFYLCPFTKPGYVRHLFEENEVSTYQEAFEKLLDREDIDYKSRRNVLIAHQFFVTAGKETKTCDSEQVNINVGGLDSIDTSVISEFDYTALGHIHGPQTLGNGNVRYCGTPLKYSVSEENHDKSITMVTLKNKKEDLQVETIPLIPLRDVKKLKGNLEELMKKTEASQSVDDYVSIVLTDDQEPYRPKDTLEERYSHILEVTIDNNRTRNIKESFYLADEDKELMPSPMEAFMEFYQVMNSQPMSAEEVEILSKIIEEVE